MHLRLVIPVGDSWRHKGRSIERLQRFCTATGAVPVLPASPYEQSPQELAAAVLASLFLPLMRSWVCIDWADIAVIFRNRGNAFVIAAHAPQSGRSEVNLVGDSLLEIDAYSYLEEINSLLFAQVWDEGLSLNQFEASNNYLYSFVPNEIDCRWAPAIATDDEQKILPVRGATIFAKFSG